MGLEGFIAFERIVRFARSPLVSGSALLGIAEIGNRITRIVTALALARCFTPALFGTMALVLAIYELVRMFIHNGVGARIVQADGRELAEVFVAAHATNWGVGVLMFAVQIILALPLQAVFHQPIAPMLAWLSVVHLIYPIGMAHFSLAQRQGRFGFIALMTFLQLSGDNLLTAAFAFEGWRGWAIILPRIAVSVLWVGVVRVCVTSLPNRSLSWPVLKDVLRFARNVFASEALNTLRYQGDKLVIGKLFGADAFARYAFAANAGSGIAFSVTNAIGTAVLPYLCGHGAATDVRRRFDIAVLAVGTATWPIILAQVVLARWYVPVVFGEAWAPAVPALMLACLSAVGRPLSLATSLVLRAVGEVELELRISQWGTLLFFLGLFAGTPFGIDGVLASVALVSLLHSVVFAWLVRGKLGTTRSMQSMLVEGVVS